MEIHDLIFLIPDKTEVSRVWDSPEIKLEWCLAGLKVCRSKDGAILKVANGKEISLKEDEIIPWNELIQGRARTEIFPVEVEGKEICSCRFFYYTKKEWLDKKGCIVDSDNTSPEIMRQAVLILDDMYFTAVEKGSKRLVKVKELAERAKELCPEGVDDRLRSQVLDLWKQRVRNAAVDDFLDSNVPEEDKMDALEQMRNP